MSVSVSILILAIGIGLTACAPQQQMYYWGNYSHTLYAQEKNPCEATLLQHKQALEEIIQESQQREMRIPPGVYAELGYIYFRENKPQEAVKYYKMEETVYPESKPFMQRLTQAAEKRLDQSAQ
jgi:hypothetical protein